MVAQTGIEPVSSAYEADELTVTLPRYVWQLRNRAFGGLRLPLDVF